MEKWKIPVEIDLAKIAVVGGMALSVWLASVCGEGETLFLIIPAGIAYLFKGGAK